MDSIKRDELLRSYEQVDSGYSAGSSKGFNLLFVFILALTFSGGFYLTTVKNAIPDLTDKMKSIKTEFIIRKKEKKKEVVKKKKIEKPIDLTKKPKLAQKKDDIVEEKKPEKKKVRRVYGLKKVYSKGLGTGGSLSDAVVGKVGNTINKEVDTVKATKEDLKGDVVSVTTVTSNVSIKKMVKPKYSKEMKDASIEGSIRVKVLIDIDGKCKKAIALNDIGYDSKMRAVEACLNSEYNPAKRGSEPVAVWVIISIKFQLIG